MSQFSEHDLYDMTSPVERANSASFMPKVFGWMFLGLLLTAGVAAYFAASQDMAAYFEENKAAFFIAIGVELALVFGISFFISRISPMVAGFMFLLYSAISGFVFSMIVSIYTVGSIASTFAITAGMFGAMALYGWTTKKDLSSLGSICFMALIGLIIGSIVNIIWFNETIYWILTAAGILIFCGLTAADMHKLKKLEVESMTETDRDRAAISGALTLYLDFINMFLFLLRIFGNTK